MIELVDALCSNGSARSVVELCLTPCFRRTYTTLYKALAEWIWNQQQLARLLAPYLPPPTARAFWLFGVDVTPQPRPFAQSLSDRSMVYHPNPIAGNTPVTIGHQYSTVALLSETHAQGSPSWVLPLSTARVASSEDKEGVGAAQIDALLADPTLPFHGQITAGRGACSAALFVGSTRSSRTNVQSASSGVSNSCDRVGCGAGGPARSADRTTAAWTSSGSVG